jgi:hypothetical protein
MSEQDQIMLSEELLTTIRTAATISQRLGEKFISTRALLLALLDDPTIGAALSEVVPREKLEELEVSESMRAIAAKMPEPVLRAPEKPAIQRYDTLLFTMPNEKQGMWLSHEALSVMVEGGRRAEGRYLPKHLAFGIAAEAVRTPGVFAALHISPGEVTDAIYKL